MKALISPLEPKADGVRIAEVQPDDKIFAVAEPLYWVTCPDDCNADTWYFNTQINQCVEIPPYVPSAEDNKQTAVSLLQQTDWTTIADVADPQLSNPYLANQAEFIQWRSQVRAIAVSPIAGNLGIFNQIPQESWMYV